MRAAESFGDERYRRQILHAMAEIRDEYVTTEQLRLVARCNGSSSPARF